MRNRTYGGVRGLRGQPLTLLDPKLRFMPWIKLFQNVFVATGLLRLKASKAFVVSGWAELQPF